MKGYRALNKGKFREEGGSDPKDKSSFKAFLFTIARNSLIGYWRRKKDVILVGIDVLMHVGNGNDPEKIDLRIDLHNKISLLQDIYADIIRLHYLEGFNLRETARILGISYAKVRRCHLEATKKLKKLLNGDYP